MEAAVATLAHNSPAMPYPSIRRSYKSVSGMLADELRDGILSGTFEEGQYLRQRSLARQYGVSEVAVREALRVLEGEGFVETELRRGARVSRLSVDEVQELWEVRILLEKLLTQHAVPAFQAQDLAQAKSLLEVMSQEKDPVRWLDLNRQFHHCLYRPAGRLRILRFATNLRNMMDRYLRVRLGALQLFEVATKEHCRILAAYRAGNVALAVKRVEAHLQRTADSIIAFLLRTRLHSQTQHRQREQRGS
jgi:DNA-binding GntR family transcriptional regulator